MKCDRYRAAASARLDGEPVGMSVATLDQHLTTCGDCARWLRDAIRVTRLARLDVTPVPDLAERIVAGVVLPARRVARRRRWLRVGLVVAAIVQLGIGVPAMFDDSIGMAMAAHAAHEMAAWNVALGAAFAAAALLPRRAAGMIPLLATFLAVLGVLSVRDMMDGAVTVERLVTHVAALVGLVLLVGLDRTERSRPPAPAGKAIGRGVTGRGEDGGAGLRTVA